MMPVGESTLGPRLERLRQPVDGGDIPAEDVVYQFTTQLLSSEELTTETEIFETGIKASVFSSLMFRGGKTGLFSSAGVGKTVPDSGAY